ncbi:MAG: hypothetical protein AAGA77_24575 [Bacteroidota bacterium]
MNPTLKNFLFVILALLIGGMVNMGIIVLGPNIIPSPEGVNPQDINSIKENANLYSAKHFIIPFLAHALGTLVGAFIIAKLASTHHKKFALIVGAVFCLGGIIMAIGLPEFWKFSIIDILLAYFPMALLGWSMAGKP